MSEYIGNFKIIVFIVDGCLFRPAVQNHLQKEHQHPYTLTILPQGACQCCHHHRSCHHSVQDRQLVLLSGFDPLLHGDRHHALLQGSCYDLGRRKTVPPNRSAEDHGDIQCSILLCMAGLLPPQWNLHQLDLHWGAQRCGPADRLQRFLRISSGTLLPLPSCIVQLRAVPQQLLLRCPAGLPNHHLHSVP
jgi:hypothetical protein